MPVRLSSLVVALLFAVTAALPVGPTSADDNEVDLLLVLAADVSSSVDAEKFRLQREGYAVAISDPGVVGAMTAGSRRRIAVCFIEWADDYEQRVIVSWTLIGSADDAHGFAGHVRTAPRSHSGRTSIGAGIDYALAQLESAPFRAPRRVIDVSGDGTSNAERSVTRARDEAVARGVTINGLAILSERPISTNPRHTHPPGGLAAYYHANVIGGPGAFVVAATGYADFGRSLIGKLIKEVAGMGGGGAVHTASRAASPVRSPPRSGRRRSAAARG
jgi:hypothetical protein